MMYLLYSLKCHKDSLLIAFNISFSWHSVSFKKFQKILFVSRKCMRYSIKGKMDIEGKSNFGEKQ